jgi:predicted SPOUT superfamily RNA methylase MTH1
VVETKRRAVPDRIIARAPTENQKNTKYSLNNLAWFIKNKTLDELKNDRRFMKDCKRYFATPEALRDKVLGTQTTSNNAGTSQSA